MSIYLGGHLDLYIYTDILRLDLHPLFLCLRRRLLMQRWHVLLL